MFFQDPDFDLQNFNKQILTGPYANPFSARLPKYFRQNTAWKESHRKSIQRLLMSEWQSKQGDWEK